MSILNEQDNTRQLAIRDYSQSKVNSPLTPNGDVNPNFLEGGGPMAGLTGIFKNKDNSLNFKGIGAAFGAVQSIGSIINSFKQSKLAQDQFNLQSRAFETNLFNERQAFNGSLADKLESRATAMGNTRESASEDIKLRSI